MKYTIGYEATKGMKNRFNLQATIKNDNDEFDIRTYTIKYALSWAEIGKIMISWFNDGSLAEAAVRKVLKNGGKENV